MRGDGRGPPCLLTRYLHPQPWAPGAGYRRQSWPWQGVGLALTFPRRVRSLVKVPSYKESSSERRIPGP